MKLKTKISRKQVMQIYQNVIEVGYCNLQYLLSMESPDYYYGSNTEGWYADVYDFGDTAIVTGYRAFGNVKPSYELCKEYDSKGKTVRDADIPDIRYEMEYEERKTRMRDLISQFIEAAIEEAKHERA